MDDKIIEDGKAPIVRSMMDLIQICIEQRVDQWFDVIMKAVEEKDKAGTTTQATKEEITC